jgi:hypothetical protein
MRKLQLNLEEDGMLILWNLVFLSVGIWGVADMARNGVPRPFQLLLFVLFFGGLCGIGCWGLRQQARLRACPKCATLMQRISARGDGIRRQQCESCGTVVKTARKGAFGGGVGKDSIEEPQLPPLV